MFVLVCIILLLNPESATEGAREGLRVAFETVIPAILPFSVFSSALVYSGSIEKIASPRATAFITGFLGGYPTGCKTVCDLYDEGLIEKHEAEKLLAYVNNGGIIFGLNVCGRLNFASKAAGVVIFSSGVAAALITGILFSKGKSPHIKQRKNKKMPPMAILGKSIASGGSVIINIASSLVVTYALIDALKLESLPFLAGICEMTKGITYAGKIKHLPLASFFFSFGGLGVFAQSSALCAKSDISMKWYLPGKILTGVTAYVITYATIHTSWDIAAFSMLAVTGIACAVKLIKRYAKA